MSVRNRLALVLAAVLLPLLLGAGLVVAVVVPAQLRTEAAERLDVAAAAVSAMQAQSCVAAGDAARVMALAVVAGEPADSALRSGLQRLARLRLDPARRHRPRHGPRPRPTACGHARPPRPAARRLASPPPAVTRGRQAGARAGRLGHGPDPRRAP